MKGEIRLEKDIIHLIKLPWRIAIGEGAINEIPGLLDELNVESVLAVIGSTTFDLVGNEIAKILRENDYDFDFLLVENADIETVKKTENKVTDKKFGALLGIGGGKNIDVAKMTAFNLKIPYISVPTSPSHDGIASACCSISNNGIKHSTFLEPPAAIVADMKYLSKVPQRFYASGAGDVLAKSTSLLDWKLEKDEKNNYYGEYASQIVSLASQIIMKNSNLYKKDYESAVRLLTEALISCGYAMCIAGSSNPCSGSEHLFSHALDFLAPDNKSLHGEKCALGTLIMSFYHDKDYHTIRQTLLNLGLPINAEQIGIPPEIIVKAVTIAHKMRENRFTILDKLGIREGKEGKVENDLRLLGII